MKRKKPLLKYEFQYSLSNPSDVKVIVTRRGKKRELEVGKEFVVQGKTIRFFPQMKYKK